MLDVAGGSADNRIMTNDETLKTIRTIIRSHVPDPSYRLFVFGSRATGTARKFSDMDIGIQGDVPVPSAALEYIREDLENSSIPYKVEVVDFTIVEPTFKAHALKQTQQLS